MKALVKREPLPEKLEWTDWEEPNCGDKEILVAVKAAGICGTDLSIFDWAETTVREHKVPFPIIMGHEFAGNVIKVGSKVKKDIKLGDLVTANNILNCGKCRYCLEGATNVCDNRPTFGIQIPGFFTEKVAIREENIYKVDANVTPEIACLCEPLCVALHAAEKIPPHSDDIIAVLGSGSIGLLLVLVLKEVFGVKKVFLTGTAGDNNRLAIGEELGAEIINVSKEDAQKIIFSATNNQGCDIVFETAGHPQAVLQAIELTRKLGKVGLVGMPHDSTPISTTKLCIKEMEIVAIRAHTPKTWESCIRLLPQLSNNLEKIITHRLPMHQAAEGFRLVKNKEAVKVILTGE